MQDTTRLEMIRSEEIQVTVLFFGAARDAAGTDEISLAAAVPASVRTVKETVFSRYKAVARFAKSLMIAVNQEYATDETPLKNQDEVAFLPPVSGG